ncbi:hypothetical protein Q1695_003839 [Nippostrongylus brasiliensis]|nr:hypothetical protein Q1695_003839 [Nippostrongylus brasiliensis]
MDLSASHRQIALRNIQQRGVVAVTAFRKVFGEFVSALTLTLGDLLSQYCANPSARRCFSFFGVGCDCISSISIPFVLRRRHRCAFVIFYHK